MQSKLGRKAVRRRMIRVGFISVNLAVVALVVFFVVQNRTSNAVSPLTLHASANTPVTNPLDQVSSADIAQTVSTMTGMTESTAIKNTAESEDTKLASAPVTDNVISKPQVVSTSFFSNKDIQSYTTVSGDSVSALATKFGVTSDSIRWSNGLTGDALNAGVKLLIPPVGHSGIVYTVKSGDTVDSIAQKYQADKNLLIAANDAEQTGLQTGMQIIIPNGQQPVQTYRSVAPAQTAGFAFGMTAIYGSNGYDYGYCTWWVASRRAAVGKPLPSNLGNASSWGYLARAAGLATGSTPQQYAAAVTSTRGEGHVVFVESVNADGSIYISEMNHLGWAVKDYATIPADVASHYIYIY